MSIKGNFNDKCEWVDETVRETGYYIVRRMHREVEVAHWNHNDKAWSFVGCGELSFVDPLTIMDKVFP